MWCSLISCCLYNNCTGSLTEICSIINLQRTQSIDDLNTITPQRHPNTTNGISKPNHSGSECALQSFLIRGVACWVMRPIICGQTVILISFRATGLRSCVITCHTSFIDCKNATWLSPAHNLESISFRKHCYVQQSHFTCYLFIFYCGWRTRFTSDILLNRFTDLLSLYLWPRLRLPLTLLNGVHLCHMTSDRILTSGVKKPKKRWRYQNHWFLHRGFKMFSKGLIRDVLRYHIFIRKAQIGPPLSFNYHNPILGPIIGR